jgi:hypothetical protein
MLFGLGAGVAGYRAWPAYENNILRIRLPPFYLDTAALPNCINNTRSEPFTLPYRPLYRPTSLLPWHSHSLGQILEQSVTWIRRRLLSAWLAYKSNAAHTPDLFLPRHSHSLGQILEQSVTYVGVRPHPGT